MSFCEFHRPDGKPVFVNVDLMTTFTESENGTELRFGEAFQYVRETADEILKAFERLRQMRRESWAR